MLKKKNQERSTAGVESADKWCNKKDYTLAALGLMKSLPKTVSVECKRQKADFREPNLELGEEIIKCVFHKNELGDTTVIVRWAESQERW